MGLLFLYYKFHDIKIFHIKALEIFMVQYFKCDYTHVANNVSMCNVPNFLQFLRLHGDISYKIENNAQLQYYVMKTIYISIVFYHDPIEYTMLY